MGLPVWGVGLQGRRGSGKKKRGGRRKKEKAWGIGGWLGSTLKGARPENQGSFWDHRVWGSTALRGERRGHG